MPRRVVPTPSAPAPAGPYSPAVEGAGLVFLSGQVGADPSTGKSVGEDVDAQARQVLSNLGVVLEDAGLGWDDVVKATIFLTDMADFAAVNEIYAEVVGSSPPARSTVQVAALPGGYKVEIELVAARSTPSAATREVTCRATCREKTPTGRVVDRRPPPTLSPRRCHPVPLPHDRQG